MNTCSLIAKHLDKGALNNKIKTGLKDTVCAWSGEPITEGMRIKDAVSNNWTDWAAFRHGGEYLSLDFVACLAEIIPSPKDPTKLRSLRHFSFYCDEQELRFLKRDQMLNLLMQPPRVPFVLGISEGGQKHVGYKTPVAYDAERFIVGSDYGLFMFDRATAAELLPVLQAMYSVVPGKEKQATTWFTKDEILTGDYAPSKINAFGVDRLIESENQIAAHRHSTFFRFLVYVLNKSENDNQN